MGDTTLDHWRAAASIDYLSSFLFRQAFSESYAQAVNSEVRSEAYLSHNLAGFSLNATAARYQNFFQNPVTLAFSEQVKILHLPMVEFNALEQPLPGCDGRGSCGRWTAARAGCSAASPALLRQTWSAVWTFVPAWRCRLSGKAGAASRGRRARHALHAAGYAFGREPVGRAQLR